MSDHIELRACTTRELEIIYEDSGPADGPVAVLAHGWPDDVRCWDKVAPVLRDQGVRVIAPYLRATGPTRFLSPKTLRSGAIVAMALDLAEFLEVLDLRDVTLVGYDWGARAGFSVGALFPERVKNLLAMASSYSTNVPVTEMPYALAQNFWYEWFVATNYGRDGFRKDRRRLCRYLWESWSPGWRFTMEEFSATAPSWDNPDWAEISIHAYLQRWGETSGTPEHEEFEQRLAKGPPILVPTVFLHGANDRVNLPVTSESKEHLFAKGYTRRLLPGVGHFVPREAPEEVAATILSIVRASKGD